MAGLVPAIPFTVTAAPPIVAATPLVAAAAPFTVMAGLVPAIRPHRHPMIRAPGFWSRPSWTSRLLLPASRVVAAITARRIARPGWRAPVPVICAGNATVGGAGKTTVTLALADLLTQRGKTVHILLRGYRGSAKGPRRVQPGDTAAVAGDEALLLAERAPTWTGADRAASARAAIEAGADILLMDDGLQNPGLEKTLSFLIIDGATGFGNGQVLPAGPLREPVAAAAARCQAAILIGDDTSRAQSQLPAGLPVLRARLQQDAAIEPLIGKRVFAFAGIAIPAKFFDALRRAGVEVVGHMAFGDHHTFTAAELTRLEQQARALDAILVTTPKDMVRLPPSIKVHVVGVRLVWDDPGAIATILDRLLSA